MSVQALRSSKKGFTLIELLIVIGIIGILAAIILVAVDPAKRLRQARNARRYAEANAILNAILNYTVDNRGTLPAAVSSATAGHPFVIGSWEGELPSTAYCPSSVTGATFSATSARNLGADAAFIDAYLSEIPVDPRGVNDNGDIFSTEISGYYFLRSANGRIEVGACNPESEDNLTTPQIKIKR